MKKTIIIILAIILLLVGLTVALPFMFKDKLVEKAKLTINENLNAKVEFTDFNLSLFRNFPKVSMEMENATIIGVNDFDSDTLLNVRSLRAALSLATLFNSEKRNIEEIHIQDPYIHLIANKNGNVNWDIVKKKKTNEKADTSSNTFNLKLEKITIDGGHIKYSDYAGNTFVYLQDVDIDLSGDMYGSNAKLKTNAKIDKINLDYDGVEYLSNTYLEANTDFDVNYDDIHFHITEGELLINKLPLNVAGDFRMPDDKMNFDLTLNSKESGFDKFLALVPPTYDKYLEDINTAGEAKITGSVKGDYYDSIYPAIDFLVLVDNGRFKYNQLPESVENINGEISITKANGVLDLLKVSIKDVRAQVKNNPIKANALITTPMSDPTFNAAMVGVVNFNDLKDVFPMDSVDMTGVVDANIKVNGKLSYIDKKQYEKVQSDGKILLSDFKYRSNNLTESVNIPQGQLLFTPRSIDLSNFDVKVGESDFALNGNLTNYLAYIFKKENLNGNLNLVSKNTNIDQLTRLQKNDKKNQPKDNNELAFDVPENINFNFNSTINRAVFKDLPITDINGLITVKDGVLSMNSLKMKMLNGELNMNGSYKNNVENHPVFDFGFNILNFDIPLIYKFVTGLQEFFPILSKSQGFLSSEFKINGQLDEKLVPIGTSVDGKGLLSTKDVQINESDVFKQLKTILQEQKVRNIKVKDFTSNFTVENGNMTMKPFTTKIGGQDVEVLGSLNLNKQLDVKMKFDVQREVFGNEIKKILKAIPGEENIASIPAAVNVVGPVNKPQVKVDLSDAQKAITEHAKKAAKEDLDKSLKKLGDGLKEIFK